MAAAIGMGGALGIGAASAASSSAATSSAADVDAATLAPREATGDIQAAIWSPTKFDGKALTELLQAMQEQSPASATPTSFGP